MTDTDYLEWASHIRELDQEQVQQTYKRLKLLGNKDDTKTEQTDIETDWLYEGLIQAFINEGMLSSTSAKSLAYTKGYKAFIKCSKELRDQLENILGNTNKRSTRNTIAYLSGCALIEYCKKLKVPRQASVILLNSFKLMDAIEDQYPGYIRANMFLFVLNKTRILKHQNRGN